jgi:DNA polymerase-3 subunit epsilon
VLHDGSRVIDTFSTLLDPEKSIPYNITRITGIDDRMVAGAPKFFEVARQIVEMTQDAVFVAHNVQFDYAFVREEFNRLGFEFKRKQLCTVKLARRTFPGLRSYSLSNLKTHFGIHAERSHRALDDALATAELFERILAEQNGKGAIRTLVNQGVKESKLPEGITLDRLHALPETCGVYYFHDARGDVIYVGKSLNIRKRIFEHFSDPTPKGEKLRNGVADLSCEETGSELAALLLESAEIKKLQPRVNRAQRAKQYHGCIFTYTDQRGYRCLAPGKRTLRNLNKLDIVAEYPKLDSARSHLESLMRAFELCGKLCHLDSRETSCFQYAIKQCYGACIGEEPPETYNERVEIVIAALNRRLEGSFALLDKGRSEGEVVIIAVIDGKYQGFGYFDAENLPALVEDLLEGLQPLSISDPDASRIIRSYMEGKGRVKIIPLETKNSLQKPKSARK